MYALVPTVDFGCECNKEESNPHRPTSTKTSVDQSVEISTSYFILKNWLINEWKLTELCTQLLSVLAERFTLAKITYFETQILRQGAGLLSSKSFKSR